MGGFGEIVSSFAGHQYTQAGVMGLGIGAKTGSAYANAKYGEAANLAAAEAAEEQGKLQAYLIQKQYEADYKALRSQQEQQAAENQVLAVKRGITGASADNAMQSYAAKDQRNKERLYYNAAMQTGANSIQTSQIANQYREKARQAAWQGKAALVAGGISLAAETITHAAKFMESSESPVDDADRSTASGLGYDSIGNDLWGRNGLNYWTSMPKIGAR